MFGDTVLRLHYSIRLAHVCYLFAKILVSVFARRSSSSSAFSPACAWTRLFPQIARACREAYLYRLAHPASHRNDVSIITLVASVGSRTQYSVFGRRSAGEVTYVRTFANRFARLVEIHVWECKSLKTTHKLCERASPRRCYLRNEGGGKSKEELRQCCVWGPDGDAQQAVGTSDTAARFNHHAVSASSPRLLALSTLWL